jgi:nucleotide-binding universal stress UspA family protein
MIRFVSGAGRLVVGASGSPGSLPALRCALHLARHNNVPLVAVLAWVPPGGDLAERRYPSAYLRRIWIQDARQRLNDALDAAWGSIPLDVDFAPVIIRGEPGPSLVETADASDDVLIVGAGRRGALTRVWHGKVCRYCIAHARCSVLAVPPATAKEMGLGRARRELRHRGLTLDRALRDWDATA